MIGRRRAFGLFRQHKTDIIPDDSKSESGISCGAVFSNSAKCGGLPVFASMITAERSYKFSGFSHAFSTTVGKGRYVIYEYSDSTTVLSAVENVQSSHLLARDFFFIWISCQRREHNISFCWFPAHVSVERADEAAKNAAPRPSHAGPLPCPPACPAPQMCGVLDGSGERSQLEEEIVGLSP